MNIQFITDLNTGSFRFEAGMIYDLDATAAARYISQGVAIVPAYSGAQDLPVASLRPGVVEQLQAAYVANRLAPRGASALGGMTSWWPLNEGTGTTVTDALNPSLTGTIQGTTAGVWANGASEGVIFNGTDNQIAINPSPVSNLLREILNLSTLAGDNQLLIWFVLTHATTVSAAGIMTWGLEGTAGANAAYEGFSLAMLNTNKWLQWRDRPPGATTFTQTALNNPIGAVEFPGNGGSNTKTAVCLAIEANTALGYYEITASRANIVQAGTIAQTDSGWYTVPMLPNGASGRTRYNTAAGLTLGAIAKTGQTSVAGTGALPLPASHALRNVGFQRRASAYGGIARRIAIDLAKAPTAFPASARLV